MNTVDEADLGVATNARRQRLANEQACEPRH